MHTCRSASIAHFANNVIFATSSPANIRVSDDMVNKHKGVETALKMPAFQLNVRNQTSNNLLLAVIGIQLLTNILLILMVWMKLG
jgi:hypothetical protein